MKLIINKDRTTVAVGTWGTVNENDYEILDFEFPAELEHFNKRIVYYLGDEKVWDTIVNNKAYITNAITTKGDVKAYVWCTKENTEREADTDFRTMLFDMHFYENENADGIVPTEEQVDGFNTMLTAMNAKIDEVDALEQTIGAAEAQRQEAEATRVSNENTRESNESTRQTNEQTRQSQEAERERRTDEAIGNIEDKTAEYNQNAEEKTEAFNTNASQKTNDFNSNYTQKVNDFNTNAETKTNAFNTNATNKTNDFNSNATEKTTAFDNNATEKTSEFNTNAQNKIDEYDEHIVEYQAQIDELQEEVEELSDNMPWNTTEQATEIAVDDAAKYSKNKLELFGNTEQTQYTGVQLLDMSDTVNGYFTSDEGGTNNAMNGFRTQEYIDVGNNTSVYGRFEALTNIKIGRFWIQEYDENYNSLRRTLLSLYDRAIGNKEVRKGSITLLDNTKFIRISAYSLKELVNEEYVERNPMKDYWNNLIKATISFTDVDIYEPYVGGVSSPNQKYPQDIHVVTGNNIISIGNTNYPINLGSIELCKIGDYQDYLYKENGNWYKYEITSKIIFNGSENWRLYSSERPGRFYIQNFFGGTYPPVESFCDKFTRENYTNYANIQNNHYSIQTPNQALWFIHTDTKTLAEWKEWLSNNNVLLRYLKANPESKATITQITDETLISQLDAIYEHLKLVKGTNNITVTAADLAPYMKLSYMQDLPSKLDNLDSRLALLE